MDKKDKKTDSSSSKGGDSKPKPVSFKCGGNEVLIPTVEVETVSSKAVDGGLKSKKGGASKPKVTAVLEAKSLSSEEIEVFNAGGGGLKSKKVGASKPPKSLSSEEIEVLSKARGGGLKSKKGGASKPPKSLSSEEIEVLSKAGGGGLKSKKGGASKLPKNAAVKERGFKSGQAWDTLETATVNSFVDGLIKEKKPLDKAVLDELCDNDKLFGRLPRYIKERAHEVYAFKTKVQIVCDLDTFNDMVKKAAAVGVMEALHSESFMEEVKKAAAAGVMEAFNGFKILEEGSRAESFMEEVKKAAAAGVMEAFNGSKILEEGSRADSMNNICIKSVAAVVNTVGLAHLKRAEDDKEEDAGPSGEKDATHGEEATNGEKNAAATD